MLPWKEFLLYPPHKKADYKKKTVYFNNNICLFTLLFSLELDFNHVNFYFNHHTYTVLLVNTLVWHVPQYGNLVLYRVCYFLHQNFPMDTRVPVWDQAPCNRNKKFSAMRLDGNSLLEIFFKISVVTIEFKFTLYQICCKQCY